MPATSHNSAGSGSEKTAQIRLISVASVATYLTIPKSQDVPWLATVAIAEFPLVKLWNTFGSDFPSVPGMVAASRPSDFRCVREKGQFAGSGSNIYEIGDRFSWIFEQL